MVRPISCFNVPDLKVASKGLGCAPYYGRHRENPHCKDRPKKSWGIRMFAKWQRCLGCRYISRIHLSIPSEFTRRKGAFEPRIVLTIPQESGSGGTDSWRISDSILKNGTSTQTASEIIGENVWFSTSFNQFAQSSVNKLPVDHHLLMGMVAPRALFVIDNVGYDLL